MTTSLTNTSGKSLNDPGERSSLIASRLGVAGLSFICVVLVCLSGRDGLLNLYDRWRYEEEYGYGFLIVLIVPLLLWGRRDILIAGSTTARWPGLALVVVGQLFVVIAALAESYFIEQIALIGTILGLGLVIFGVGASRALLPLAILLLLTLPLPYTLQAMLTIKLQLLSTNIGVTLIRLIGIPVYVEGNIIDLGNYKLQVAEACSGLRYLLPLTCIAFLIANLYKAPLWKRAVVVISAAPVTILINSVRITVTAVLVDNFGIQMAEGFLHEFEGMVVFMVGVLLLVLEIIALEKFRWSNVEFESIIGGPAVSGHSRGQVKVGLPLILTVLICIVALGTITSITAASNSTPAPNRELLVDFPQHIDGWTGHPQELEPETVNVLKATDYYAGDFFETPRGPPINFFVAYYDSLNKSAAIHSPRVCLPGSGWEFASFEERKFSELASGASGTYNYVTIQKGQQKTLMYYWYQQRGRRTANEFSMKFYLFTDALFTGRKDGALVRVYTPIVGGEAEANSRLRAFTAALMQKIPAYLPR